MNEENITQCQFQPELFSKRVIVRFDQHNGSSDGGALLLKAADRRLGLTERLADCLTERRDPTKVAHRLDEMLSQRVFVIACGYPDGNDAGRLSEDPVHKMLVGREPISGPKLASQPTLSRFENTVRRSEMYRVGEALAKAVIDRHRRRLSGRAKRITIDLDPTVDPSHGEQQLSFFNGYYDSSCYLPVLGFLSFDKESEQYLFAAVLRPGNAPDKKGCLSILKRTFRLLREDDCGIGRRSAERLGGFPDQHRKHLIWIEIKRSQRVNRRDLVLEEDGRRSGELELGPSTFQPE